MKIESDVGEPLRDVVLRLTRSEIAELRDLLDDMLTDPRTATDLGWHGHVADADFQTTVPLPGIGRNSLSWREDGSP